MLLSKYWTVLGNMWTYVYVWALPHKFSCSPNAAAIWFVKSRVSVVKLRSPMKEKCSTYELHRIQLLIPLSSVVSYVNSIPHWREFCSSLLLQPHTILGTLGNTDERISVLFHLNVCLPPDTYWKQLYEWRNLERRGWEPVPALVTEKC